MGIFPLAFLSNVFVDPETASRPLEAFVNVNPIPTLASASTGLMEGDVDGCDVVLVLAVAVVITLVFALLPGRLIGAAELSPAPASGAQRYARRQPVGGGGR